MSGRPCRGEVTQITSRRGIGLEQGKTNSAGQYMLSAVEGLRPLANMQPVWEQVPMRMQPDIAQFPKNEDVATSHESQKMLKGSMNTVKQEESCAPEGFMVGITA